GGGGGGGGGAGGREWGRGGDELLHLGERKRHVRLLLRRDRRPAGRAHCSAAERACDVAGIDLVSVRELRQALQRVEEALGSFARIDCKVGPRRVADEERVAGED